MIIPEYIHFWPFNFSAAMSIMTMLNNGGNWRPNIIQGSWIAWDLENTGYNLCKGSCWQSFHVYNVQLSFSTIAACTVGEIWWWGGEESMEMHSRNFQKNSTRGLLLVNYRALFLGSTNSCASPSSHREKGDRRMWGVIFYSCFLLCILRDVSVPCKSPKAM